MKQKSKISGPGASDFLTSVGGGDSPETETLGEGIVNDAAELEPDLDAPDPDPQTREQSIGGAIPPGRDERRSE